MKRYTFFGCLLIAIFIFSLRIDAQSLADLGFADHLYHQKDYYRAVTEYQRLLSINPQKSLIDTLNYRLGWCYYRGNYWRSAARFFAEVVDSASTIELRQNAQFALIQTYFEADRPYLGLLEVQQLISGLDESESLAKAYYLQGWGEFNLGQWQSARNSFLDAAYSTKDSSFAENYHYFADLSLQGIHLPGRSPQVAWTLSAILPGSGLIYAGDTKKGLLAMLLNSVFAYYTSDALLGKRYFEAGAISLLLWKRYYQGTLSNSVQAAQDFNQRQYQQHFNQLGKDSFKVKENF